MPNDLGRSARNGMRASVTVCLWSAAATLAGCQLAPPATLRQKPPALRFETQKTTSELVACIMAAQQQRHSMPTMVPTPTGTTITDYLDGYLSSVTDIKDAAGVRQVSSYVELSPKMMMNRRRLEDISSCR